MHNRSIIFLSALLLISFSALSQKVKYKDIFALLERKQFAEAEPLLKQYLEKEQNNPNALLYMGIIYMDKHFKSQDAQANHIKDQAIHFLTQAKLKLDEREVSKNEKYYSAYKRRNIRTGNMEVRLDDIIYDIDNRISKLKGVNSKE